jgi:hypothetical protein
VFTPTDRFSESDVVKDWHDDCSPPPRAYDPVHELAGTSALPVARADLMRAVLAEPASFSRHTKPLLVLTRLTKPQGPPLPVS